MLGTWESIGSSNKIKIELQNDSMQYSVKINNEWNSVFAVGYFCSAHYDSIFITTIETNPNRFLFIKISEGYYALCLFKNLKGLKNNISSLACLVKKKTASINDAIPMNYEHIVKNRKPDIFILPDNYSGILAIAYDQPDGYTPVSDSLRGKVYQMNETNNFLFKVQPSFDLINYTTNNMKFYYKTKTNSLNPLFLYKCSYEKPDESDTNKNHVFSIGYDRIGKKQLNLITGMKLTSNVLFLKITNEKNYSERNLGHDSVYYLGKFYHLGY